MRTTAIQSPFVAKAHFSEENKWLNRYETFWFQSKDLIQTGSPHSKHWRAIRSYIEKAVIHKAHELIIFDNRKTFVSNWSPPEQKGVNIVCKYINGQLVNDHSAKLSFPDWTFNPSYLTRLSEMFTNETHNIEGELHIEQETIRDKIHFDKWQDAIEKYKEFYKIQTLILK